jgi:16S rRNA (uracil1498-N3)-methyltransferase
MIHIAQEHNVNLVLLFNEDFIDSRRVRLEGRRLKHILEVHKVKTGDELRVGLVGGLAGSGRITSFNKEFLEMEVELLYSPPAGLPVTLILALPRPKVLRRLLLSTTAIGVKRLILLNSYRVEKSFWQSPVLEPESIRRQLILGLEQACDTVMPEVSLRPFFKPFVEDELTSIKDPFSVIAHPTALEPCPRDLRSPVTLAIGPEGGFIPYEIEKFISCGFTPVHLGDRILNLEAAVPFILSRLF